MKRKGFTLIELLVVIAIIAILAAILFPVFAQAREKARQTACLSNGKQIGLGLMMYAQDYDETFPFIWPGISNLGGVSYPAGYVTWAHVTMPYIKNVGVFSCPSRPDHSWSGGVYPGTDSRFTGTPDERMGFGCNSHTSDTPGVGAGICRYGTNTGAPMAAIVAPAECYLGGDSRSYVPEAYGNALADQVSAWSWNVAPGFRHNQGATMIYCDGHSKWVRKYTVMLDFEARRHWSTDNISNTAYFPPGGNQRDDAP